MAPLLLVLTLSSCGYLSQALSTAAKLLKLSAAQQPLLEVAEITHGSEHVMDELATQVGSLQDRLNKAHQKGKESLQKQKAEFEQTLSRQRQENDVLQKQNEDILAEIELHRSNSAMWRGQAEQGAKSCQQLQQELHNLQGNMTLAQEFAQNTLNTATDLLEAPDLNILEELAREDAEKHKDELHRSRLTEIAGDDVNELAMFQLGSSSAQTPKDLLQSLMTSIDELSRQQNQSSMKIKANFDIAYQKGVEAQKALIEEQAKLNVTRVYERDLEDRLHKAADHLKKTHDELSRKLNALRVFNARLGGNNGSPVRKDSVSLLQIGQKALPQVSSLIKTPQQVLQTLNSQISSLEEGLAEKEQQSKQAVKQLKANYESQLKAQENENENTRRVNKKLGMQAEGLHESNVALREEAKELEAEIKKLEADLNVLKINISTAQEFAALAFESSGAMLHNATELKVLVELEDKENAERNNQLHQELLKQVGKSPSFFQVSAAGTKGLKNPQELLESLMASLNDLSQEQNVSEASLNASFEQEFKAGADKHQALVEEQARINATIADGETLHEKLRAAVSHLKATRDGLLEKSRSLRSYAKKVADAQEFSKSLSLLQVAAARHAPTSLPGVAKVLSKPTEVYQLMNSHVDQLGQRLGEVEQQTADKVTKQKAEYEQRLKEQHAENKRIKAANEQLSIEIETLQRSSASLRMDAKKQSATNNNLRIDIETLQKNLTFAQEFSSLALAEADADLFNASQLNVLRELDAADAAHAQEAEHQHRLSSVAKTPDLGLLELTATRGAAPDPQDLLHQLMASLADLAKEQNASAEALKVSFEKKFQEGSERHASLVKEQAELNVTKQSETELVERLNAALKYLKETGSDLAKQRESIRSFLSKLASSHAEVKDTEAKAEVKLDAQKSTHAATTNRTNRQTLSLASVGKGKVVKVGSDAAPKDDRVGNPKGKRKLMKYAKNKEHSNAIQQGKHDKHLKKATHHAKAKATGKKPRTNAKHVESATPSKHDKQAKLEEPAMIDGEPGEVKQEEPAQIEAELAKADAKDQNKAEMLMSHESAVSTADWLSPITKRMSWLMR